MTNENTIKLYVGNLPFDATEEDVIEVMKKAGRVRHCAVRRCAGTNKSRGFAHVEFRTEEDCVRAFEKVNGKLLKGRAIRLDWCDDFYREKYPQYGFTKKGGDEVLKRPSDDENSVDYLQIFDKEGRLTPQIIEVIERCRMSDVISILAKIKEAAMQNPDVTRKILAENRELCYAVLHAQFLAGLVNVKLQPLNEEQFEAAKKIHQRRKKLAAFAYVDFSRTNLPERAAEESVPYQQPLSLTQLKMPSQSYYTSGSSNVVEEPYYGSPPIPPHTYMYHPPPPSPYPPGPSPKRLKQDKSEIEGVPSVATADAYSSSNLPPPPSSIRPPPILPSISAHLLPSSSPSIFPPPPSVPHPSLMPHPPAGMPPTRPVVGIGPPLISKLPPPHITPSDSAPLILPHPSPSPSSVASSLTPSPSPLGGRPVSTCAPPPHPSTFPPPVAPGSCVSSSSVSSSISSSSSVVLSISSTATASPPGALLPTPSPVYSHPHSSRTSNSKTKQRVTTYNGYTAAVGLQNTSPQGNATPASSVSAPSASPIASPSPEEAFPQDAVVPQELVESVMSNADMLNNILSATPAEMADWPANQRSQVLGLQKALQAMGYSLIRQGN